MRGPLGRSRRHELPVLNAATAPRTHVFLAIPRAVAKSWRSCRASARRPRSAWRSTSALVEGGQPASRGGDPRGEERVGLCSEGGNFSDEDPCRLCSDPQTRPTGGVRRRAAGRREWMAFERTGQFRGRYHVLGGALSPLEGRNRKTCASAAARTAAAGHGDPRHLGTTSQRGGRGDRALPVEALVPLGVRVTRIARGVPMGRIWSIPTGDAGPRARGPARGRMRRRSG